MDSRIINNGYHVIRHINYEQYYANKVFGTAFQLKLYKNEKELSVYWQEYYSGMDSNSQIDKVRIEVNANRDVKDKHRLARLNIKETISHVKKETDDGRMLEFMHTPIDNSPSHSSVMNIDPTQEINLLISELIAETVIDLHFAT